MIFDLRGALVGLAFLGVSYCLLSVVVAWTWRFANLTFHESARARARVLFGLRVLPLVGSLLVTLLFGLPAFLLLETSAVDEDLGTLIFSICAALLFSAGLLRACKARRNALRAVAAWGKRAEPFRIDGVALVLSKVKGSGLPLLLSGIVSPQVLISDEAAAVLTTAELGLAVRHELSHLRSRDNLKKLIVHSAPFPGMHSLEKAWLEALEFAADEDAVHDREEALNLAAALIKLAELLPVLEPPAFTTAFLSSTPLVRRRVERLLARDTFGDCAPNPAWWRTVSFIALILSYPVAHYQHALLLTHRLTEWFIR